MLVKHKNRPKNKGGFGLIKRKKEGSSFKGSTLKPNSQGRTLGILEILRAFQRQIKKENLCTMNNFPFAINYRLFTRQNFASKT